MSVISIEKNTCCLCNKQNEYSMLLSSNAFGASDLDTRPPESMRSTMFAWVQRCPNCGYSSSDITRATEKTKPVIESAEYRAQLENKDFPDLANSFLCKAMIAEKFGNFAAAAMATIHAAWTCDDAEYEESAKKCRINAFKLLKKSTKKGDCFTQQNGGDIAIMTDLLRRSGQFEGALALIEENLDKITDYSIKKVLIFQIRLIFNSDTRCHAISECAEIQKRTPPHEFRFHEVFHQRISLPQRLEIIERQMILGALEKNKWLMDRTAQSLGMNEPNLWRKMKKYNILNKKTKPIINHLPKSKNMFFLYKLKNKIKIFFKSANL
jgi:hypothetical protein